MLKVTDMYTAYGQSEALHGISFEGHKNETVAIMGRNGMGKTTLFKSLMGVLPLKSGRIEVAGHDVSKDESYKRVAKGIAYVEKTGNTNDEIMTAASSMVGQVDAVFTPTDNVVMAAAAAVSETLTKGGIPFYTGADSFVTAGAFATCGVNYTELGTYTADMALDILETGVVPAYHVMDGGIITVNTETAAALGIDYSAFNDLAGQVVEVTTAE